MNIDFNAKPGELITLGTYPQAACGDVLPMQWRVLNNSAGELLVVSEYIVDCKRYHGEYRDVSWADCDLRQWLNGEFYDTAFSSTEKLHIANTHCTGNGEQSPDTEDTVFLLSAAEVKTLMDTSEGKLRRRAVGTDFATLRKDDGCWLYVYDKQVEKDYIVEGGERKGCSWWWLRTRLHESSSRAAFVGPRSSIRSYARVHLHRNGVRPALTIHPLH